MVEWLVGWLVISRKTSDVHNTHECSGLLVIPLSLHPPPSPLSLPVQLREFVDSQRAATLKNGHLEGILLSGLDAHGVRGCMLVLVLVLVLGLVLGRTCVC